MTFEELVQKRKTWINSSRENNFDFSSILAGLYNDPSHFIFELLQNAEDEGATEVRIELYSDRLDFYHNGKDFDVEDIDGVTGIGISKKKEDLTAIGKFGVGFKSVFAIAETPIIISGDYKIIINDFVVPSTIEAENVPNTLIRLPFNHKLRNQSEVFELINRKLRTINLKTILFLRNIQEIQWQTPTEKGHYLRETKSFEHLPHIKRVTILSPNIAEEFLVFERLINIDVKQLKIEVAFKLGKDKNGKERIIPENDSKLVVYFPTEKETRLNFVIQGPYRTTPNRENIPLQNEAQNKFILQKTAELVADSLPYIKDLGYLDVDFLTMLPINPSENEHNIIYQTIYDKIKEKLGAEPLLPSYNGNYIKANEALLARGKDLPELLSNEDINTLFQKKYWLSTDITYDRTRELRDYLLQELEIPEVDFESFARKIDAQFLRQKKDEWIINFYIKLLDQKSLWTDSYKSQGFLKFKPIIRTEDNAHIAPFNSNGKLQVYLPSEMSSKYKTVKKVITENEDALNFLKELGLRKPDLIAEVRELIIPKYQNNNVVVDDDYYQDFIKIVKAYDTIPSNQKNDLKQELQNLPFIIAQRNEINEEKLLKPTEVYFPTEDLLKYFDSNTSIYFVSDKVLSIDHSIKVKNFLTELGASLLPRRIKIEGNLTWEEKSKLRYNQNYTNEVYVKDYTIDGLDFLLSSITKEKSILLLKLLTNSIKDLSSWEANQFFQGEYCWFYYSRHSSSFDAKFLKILNQTPWLFDKNGAPKKPSEISFSDLADGYIKESSNINVLVEKLSFKNEPEILDQLPQEYRKKLELVKDIPYEQLERLKSEIEAQKSLDQQTTWKPNVEPESIIGIISEAEPNNIMTPDLSNQPLPIEPINGGEEEPPSNDNPDNDESKTPDIKLIGKWGELFVFNSLKNKYQNDTLQETETGFIVTQFPDNKLEIVWLNKNGDKGKGYDFVMKKNDVEIEYIEVKTKTKDSDELVKVNGQQWEWARKLYDQGKGNQYCFYLVKNAGEENAEIVVLRNPIKLWKDGKLYAHPVNFKL